MLRISSLCPAVDVLERTCINTLRVFWASKCGTITWTVQADEFRFAVHLFICDLLEAEVRGSSRQTCVRQMRISFSSGETFWFYQANNLLVSIVFRCLGSKHWLKMYDLSSQGCNKVDSRKRLSSVKHDHKILENIQVPALHGHQHIFYTFFSGVRCRRASEYSLSLSPHTHTRTGKF